MDRITTFNPERLRWCLADRGETLEECASGLGMSAESLAKVLAGEIGPTPGQLRAMANYFARSLLFFIERGSVDEPKVRGAQFRTLANQKPDLSPAVKAVIERAERQREVFLSLRDTLEWEDFPRFDPPDLTGLSPRHAAAAVRTWLGLSERNTFDACRQAIENRGVLVFRSNGYAGKWQIAKQSPVHGFSLYYQDCPVILVRKLDAEARQTFTLAHELAHLLLHRASVIDDAADLAATEGTEREANAFAGHLLVPDTFLLQVADAGRPDDVSRFDEWLNPHCRQWGVSAEVILRRLMDAGRLSRGLYLAYRQWRDATKKPEEGGGSREYRYREPRHLFGDRYVRLVLGALSANEITANKASSFLDDVKIRDLHKLESYYAHA